MLNFYWHHSNTFELWMWRKILRVPWIVTRTNISVIEVKPKRSLEATRESQIETLKVP
jgi:hypothetical protein